MYFKQLRMHGFKSFAEPVTIDFNQGITCIVGPNGSGKSNISDAIRWVLGEQSPKALRGGKMQEVIFAGTSDRREKGMAEVTLVIDNCDGVLKIDYNEVEITRRMYRSGESEYLINGSRCRLADIRELIMDTGIGVDGYSIIGQGKIAEIVSGKPESRREIFEEAAGISMYKTRKIKAERDLEKTNDNLVRVTDIINEIEKQVDKLEKDSTKAEKYLALKKNYEELEINIILKQVEKITKDNNTYEKDIEKLNKDIDTAKAEFGNIEREKDRLAAEKTEKERRSGEARDEIMSFVQQISDVENREQRIKGKIVGIEKEKKHIQNDINDLTEKIEKEEFNLANANRECSNMEAALIKAETDYDNARIALEEASSHVQKYDELVKNGQEKLFGLHRKVTEEKSEQKSIEHLRQNLLKRKNEIVFLNENAFKNRKDAEEELAKLKRMRDEQEKKGNEAEKDVIDLEKRLKTIVDELEEEKEKSDKTKLEYSKVLSRKRTMEEMEESYQGYNSGVKSIMKAHMKGIRGLTAELMNVPQGYELAIETAMGGAMQNIICDTDHDAKKGVQYLKNNRTGRLTFLPVTSIHGRKFRVSEKMQNQPGYLGIGSEIISFDSEYSGIYDYLLGRVIIVDNMDTAIRFLKMGTGFRFVTLEGEVVGNSGAITGGRYKNRSANILERKAEIERLTEHITMLEGKINRLRELIFSKADKKKHIEEILESANLNRNNIRLSIIAIEGKTEALEGKLAEEQSHGGRYRAELEQVEEELLRTGESIEFLRTEIVAAENEKEEIDMNLRKNIDIQTRSKKKLKILEDTLTEARINVNSCKGRKENYDQLKNRINDVLEEHRSKINEKRLAKQLLVSEYEEVVSGRDVQAEDVDILKEKKRSLEKLVEKLSREKEVLTGKEKIAEDEKRRKGIELNSFVEQKTALEIKLAKNETRLETEKDRLWDDFEVAYVKAMEMKKENFALNPALKEARRLKGIIKDMGEVNLLSIDEYKEVSQRYEFLSKQKSDIVQGREELKQIIVEMDRTIRTKFKDNFDQVLTNFQFIFRELFGGGHAKLTMDNPDNPLDSGIDIVAQPPGKKLQNINLMSGGEKTMTAIALMFAVLRTKPTPFCILDEVEAALDETNIGRFANYLRNFRQVQFALITHQKVTMEYADVLYGITMAEQGVSKVISLKLGDDFDL